MVFSPEFKPSTIKEGRNSKKLAREENVNLTGESSSYKEILVPTIEQHVGEAIIKHRGWIKSELRDFRRESKYREQIPDAEITDALQDVFKKRVKQYLRLNEVEPEQLISEKTLDTLFEQTAFDFIESVRMSRRRGDTAKQALDFAKNSHWLDPRTIDHLVEKYKDQADLSVIKSAIARQPRDPDGLINSYLDNVTSLTAEYLGRVDESVIKHTALEYPKNPKAFIESYLQTLERLEEKYKEQVVHSVIKIAASNYPKNPDAFIDSYILNVEELAKKYEGRASRDIVKKAVLHAPKNPDAYILRSINKLRM